MFRFKYFFINAIIVIAPIYCITCLAVAVHSCMAFSDQRLLDLLLNRELHKIAFLLFLCLYFTGLIIAFLFSFCMRTYREMSHISNKTYRDFENIYLAFPADQHGYDSRLCLLNSFYESLDNADDFSIEMMLDREKYIRNILDFHDSFYQVILAIGLSVISSIFFSCLSSDIFLVIVISLAVVVLGSVAFALLKSSRFLPKPNIYEKKLYEYELLILGERITEYNKKKTYPKDQEVEEYTRSIVLGQIFLLLKSSTNKKMLRDYMSIVRKLNLTAYDKANSLYVNVVIAEKRCQLVYKKDVYDEFINEDYLKLYNIIKELQIPMITVEDDN